jgi:hypothetical protein
LTNVEESVVKRLKKGKATTDFQNISLLNEALDSQEAQLKVI